MSNLEKYDGVFVSIFNVDSSELNKDFAYRLVKRWDSITHLALVTAIEDEFDIMFDSDDILGFLSYEEGKKIMAKYQIVI
ncbi:MAG TPA: acyl carrier protein [Bacteroidales bacterium]|jgi:acyl carrier protein|nr:acyl carrier protein [Bacteroidales bacterium]